MKKPKFKYFIIAVRQSVPFRYHVLRCYSCRLVERGIPWSQRFFLIFLHMKWENQSREAANASRVRCLAALVLWFISSCREISRKTSGTRVKEAAQEDLVLNKLVYHSTEFWDRKHSRTLRVIFSLDVVSHENICAYNFVIRTFGLKMANWELYNWSKLVITIASEVNVGWLYRRNPRKMKQLSVGFDHQIIFYPEN